MDDEDETTYKNAMFLCFNNKIHIVFTGERDKESTTPWLW